MSKPCGCFTYPPLQVVYDKVGSYTTCTVHGGQWGEKSPQELQEKLQREINQRNAGRSPAPD